MSSSRIPRLALVAWAVALVTLAGLALAVAHYLAADTGHHHHSAAAALTRGGGGEITRPLHSVLFTAWHLDATALAVVVVLAAAYLTGVALVPVRSPGQRWPLRHTASFLLGLAVAAFATNGSIAVYDQVLFSAHMAGHLALVMVAPALLMWGRPLRLLITASAPARARRRESVLRGRTVAVLTAPPVALAMYTVVIVGSHLTGLMDVVMRNDWAGQAEHLGYLVAGCWFFVLVVGDEPIRWRLGSPARWLLLAIAMAVDTFTGIILMQGTTAVGLVPSALAVDALGDTRTGGAIMWFGGDAIMAVVMVVLVVDWLRNVDHRPAESGWLEQARTATFVAHTADGDRPADRDDEPRGPVGDIDTDDDAHAAYNRWLARIDQR
ncbi:putative copper resistance protein D [Jatrophihabitans endophyticus]|uniref:Putative copper resistance protein D n=1 Tax=Jatrophihabitans endophyticus TaxID=1206085 RepID=A0A1M5L3H0_9ACTN|nr:cytochrome c oxidase assembly protein [Jatrophihabitans endophyticus]SHG59339.1 putative copper resistance protein D [Jatrophihabitans endophyticus]